MTRHARSTSPKKQARSNGIDWDAALREHGRWLRTVVRARLGESQALDDVMQEISLAALGGGSPTIDPDKVAAWLYRVAIRQALLYRRKQGRRRKLHDNYGQRLRPTEREHRESDPLDWLLADERRALIRRALDRLPRRDAEILLLKYTENWTYHKLAELLGVTESAVESRLHRARARMRRELAALQVTTIG